MEFLVCVKIVPEVSNVKLDPETNNLIRDGVKMIINPPDLNAVALAVKLKKQVGGKVTVISMGPDSIKEQLRQVIEIGADEAFVVESAEFKGSDTLATAYTLAKTAEHLGKFDMVLTGTQTLDGDTGQVGPEIAENLNINQATYVTDLTLEDDKIIVERNLQDGTEKIEVKLPALVSIVRDTVEIPKPNIKTKMASKKAEFKVLTPDDIKADHSRLGVKGSPTSVAEVFPPEELEKGIIIEGENPQEKVDALIKVLVEKKLVG